MKKVKIFCCILAMLVCMVQPVCATEAQVEETIEYFENGDYIETVIVTYPQTYEVIRTRTGSKTSTYKNADGEAMWSITVSAEFVYEEGAGSGCKSVTGKAESYNSNWKVTEAVATKSGETASATTTATQYLLLVPIGSIEKTVTLTCDWYGNLS